MSKSFDEFKRIIIKHPKRLCYNPFSEHYDENQLLDICSDSSVMSQYTEDDGTLVGDFVEISTILHFGFQELYATLLEQFNFLNLKGKYINEIIIASINREFKVIVNKRKSSLQQLNKENTYNITDIFNYKLQAADNSGRYIDARGALENFIDCANLVLNYLRFFQDKDFFSDHTHDKELAGRIVSILRYVSQFTSIKDVYFNILYNNGFVKIDSEKKSVIFDYNDYKRLKLERAGDLMFLHRHIQVLNKIKQSGLDSRFRKFETSYRIKRIKNNKGCLEMKFGQGINKLYHQVLIELNGTIISFYEFLEKDVILPNFKDVTIDEAVVVWAACIYLCLYVIETLNFDISVRTREDYEGIPNKIKKGDLVEFIIKITAIKRTKIVTVIDSLTANHTQINDIWSSPFYPLDDYLLLPFFPISYTNPFHMIDQLLRKGGCDLEERGKWFEKYLYKKMVEEKTSYPSISIPSRVFSLKGHKKEEIDLLISLKKIVILIEAKCIHYSMTSLDYSNAWSRLMEGCEQASRKAEFVKQNPQIFKDLGDYSSKEIIPVVVTNYPIYTGCSHKNVYITDGYSFLSYMHSGMMTARVMSQGNDDIAGLHMFYNNEDEFSDKFKFYLQKNRIKELLCTSISIEKDIVMEGDQGWKYENVTASVNNNPCFNIDN